jgi:hypothetical protein
MTDSLAGKRILIVEDELIVALAAFASPLLFRSSVLDRSVERAANTLPFGGWN